jgi:hypothetical protein
MSDVADDIYLPATRALSGRETALQFLAVPVALLALPVYLAGGWPLRGYALAVGLWVANRLLQLGTGRFILGLPQTLAVAVAGVTFLTRAWGVMIALLLTVHFAGRDVAVPAAILFAILYTVDLATRGLTYANARRRPIPTAPRTKP